MTRQRGERKFNPIKINQPRTFTYCLFSEEAKAQKPKSENVSIPIQIGDTTDVIVLCGLSLGYIQREQGKNEDEGASADEVDGEDLAIQAGAARYISHGPVLPSGQCSFLRLLSPCAWSNMVQCQWELVGNSSHF